VSKNKRFEGDIAGTDSDPSCPRNPALPAEPAEEAPRSEAVIALVRLTAVSEACIGLAVKRIALLLRVILQLLAERRMLVPCSPEGRGVRRKNDVATCTTE
jgi:hypothetical protein